MDINIAELRENIKENQFNTADNIMLTNELIVDELMIKLGYNKKKDSGVKRLYNDSIDWSITTATGNRIAVKTFSTNVDLENIAVDFNDAVEYAKASKFSVLLVTNGIYIKLYRFNKETTEYTMVKKFSLVNDNEETFIDVLKAISKDDWDLSIIDSIIDSNVNTLDNNARELIENYEKRIKELESQIEELKNTSSTSVSEVNDDIKAEIANYRKQIQDLTVELTDAKETIGRLERELEQAHDEINNLSGVEVRKAEELLAVIEDNEELERNYVAVINTELIQYESLNTFVGRVLQKLYEIKSFEASQYIFNGDVFTLIQPAVNNDLMMNNKAYDIDLDGLHEDLVLNKLRLLFSHFDDVIFRCKKIGSIIEETEDNETVDESTADLEDTDELLENTDELPEDFDEIIEDTDELPEDFDEIISNNSDNETEDSSVNSELPVDFDTITDNEETDEVSLSDIEDIADILSDTEPDNSEPCDEQSTDDEVVTGDFESSDIFDDNINENDAWTNENEFSEPISTEDTEDIFGDESIDSNEYLLVGQLLQIDGLIWTDEKVRFNNIKYVGNNSVTFNVNKDNGPLSNEQLLNKCIDAVLAIESYNGNSSIVNLIKQVDLSNVNNFIKLFTTEYNGYPRINGTQYVIVGVESVQQVASILLDICNALQIETDEIFVYFSAQTSSEYIIANYEFAEESVQLRENIEFEAPDEMHVATAIIKGDMFNEIAVTKNSLQAHRNIFSKAIAVKTKYLSKLLATPDDLVETVEQMLFESIKLGVTNINVGNIIGENYKLLSTDAQECGENPLELSYQGKTVFMANIEEWQIPYALIKIHTFLFNNTSIALKLNVNVEAINFYGEEFETAEPSLCLAVRSFVDYIANNIKK